MLREQDFYDRLAVFFDVMTDWPARLAFELPFLRQVIGAAGRRVLDAACGTGWHAIALAQAGYEVTAADISPLMMARAQANAAAQGVVVRLVRAAFSELPQRAGADFDALLCLGNSLVHVLGDDDLRASLAAMHDCLRPGGLLVLHNLNYDKRVVEQPRWFQVSSGHMDDRETLVWRFADYGHQLITFNIAVFQKGDNGSWSVQVQSTPQRPWLSHELTAMLAQTGFADIVPYGNLAGESFIPSGSGDLVLVAKRV